MRKVRVVVLVLALVLVVATAWLIFDRPMPVPRIVGVTFRGHHASYTLPAEYSFGTRVLFATVSMGWLVALLGFPLWWWIFRGRQIGCWGSSVI